MEKEIFKVYKDTRNTPKGALWEVSNLGSVRKNGEDYIPYERSNGYLEFGGHYLVHRAVAELFVFNHENKPTVDHKNRCIHDNRACNLRWATPKEQAANRDNESIINALSKFNVGNKYFLGHKHSENTKAKLRATALGKVWVFNPTTEHLARINSSQLNDYLDKGYVRGNKNKGIIGKVWVNNPTTQHRTLVNPSELNDYLAKGYIKGKKIKK